jgi:hypothetical protein
MALRRAVGRTPGCILDHLGVPSMVLRLESRVSDLPLNFHPAAIRASAGLICYPSLDRRKVEFSGLLSRRQAGCAGGSDEGNRGLVADCPVRSILVVVLAPILQLFTGVGKGQEPMRVQALGAQAAVEGFNESSR